jgi:putative DNA primase/helicase
MSVPLTVPDGGTAVSELPRPRRGEPPDRTAWIADAEQYVTTLVLPSQRVPASHPARAWDPDLAAEVEAAGLLLYKTGYAAATRVMTEARESGDLEMLVRAEQWRKELGRVKRGLKLEAPKPGRWLTLAEVVRAARSWLPEDAFDDGHERALTHLAEVAEARKTALDQAHAEALSAAVAAEVERRSAPGAWEAEQERRRAGERERRIAAAAAKGKQGPPPVPSPDQPMAVARHLQPAWERDGVLILRRWRGAWMHWQGSFWTEVDDGDMRSWLWKRLEHSVYVHVDGRSGIKEQRPWAPTKPKIGNLWEAFEAVANLPSRVEPPSWADGRETGVVIPCRNGLLDLQSRKLTPPSPLYFNTSAVPFDYNPRAPEPARWFRFLGEVFPDDPQAIAALQERFGYILSGRRDLQKIFLIVGPTRSGKGTIAAILTALVGAEHTASPTLAGLATNFGLAPLIGKSLAVIPDARMPRDSSGIVENLLMISGQDRVTIDRKHRDAWTGQLPTQLVILSNELPSLPDAAAAVVGRLDIARMTESFYGREDLELLPTLMRELPGIFNWALGGLDRLAKRGRLIEPESSTEAKDLLRDTSSPIKRFMDERCELDPDASVLKETLYQAWQAWCLANRRDHVGIPETFARALFAAAPKVKGGKATRDAEGGRPPLYRGIRLKPMPGGDWHTDN